MRAVNIGLLCVLVSALGLPATVACSTGDGVGETDDVGTLSLNLSGVSSTGVRYRLRNAEFTVDGPTAMGFSTEANPDAEKISRELTAGNYEIFLESGWFLERQTATGFEQVQDASLVSGNPVQFSIADQVVTPVVFRFRDGDEIVVIGSGTLEVSIEVEKGATCQAPLTSCDGACVDVQTDTNNCGSCGAVCAGGAACVNGTCVLECAPPTRDCDSNLINGCETNVSVDLNNCGTCGNVCQAGPNSSPVCQSGTCQITCTSPAFANCDMNPSNGCEVPLDTNPSCGSTGLGDLPGDRPAGSSADGVGERSFRLHVFEDDSGIFSHDLSVGFTLATPPGASYRLEANCDGCGAVVSGNSVVLKWQEESVGFDSGRDVFVNVVYQGGTSCQPWHLQIQTDVPGAFTCSPK